MTSERKGESESASASDRTRVLEFVKKHNVDHKGVPTLALAKHLFGPAARTSDVNPLLYQLQRDSLIFRTGTVAPRWHLRTLGTKAVLSLKPLVPEPAAAVGANPDESPTCTYVRYPSFRNARSPIIALPEPTNSPGSAPDELTIQILLRVATELLTAPNKLSEAGIALHPPIGDVTGSSSSTSSFFF
jgi:hypothetical protein